jgi:hypothetical protein
MTHRIYLVLLALVVALAASGTAEAQRKPAARAKAAKGAYRATSARVLAGGRVAVPAGATVSRSSATAPDGKRYETYIVVKDGLVRTTIIGSDGYVRRSSSWRVGKTQMFDMKTFDPAGRQIDHVRSGQKIEDASPSPAPAIVPAAPAKPSVPDDDDETSG